MLLCLKVTLLTICAALGVDVTPPADDRAYAPGIFSDSQGTILVWAEPTKAAEGGKPGSSAELWSIVGAQFGPNGWSEPFEVTQANRESLFLNWADVPAVARGVDGPMIVTWLPMVGQGTYAYHVFGATSADDGRTWQMKGPIHDDRSPTEHGFVSMVAQPDAQVRAFWLDGRNMARGHAQSHGTDHGHGMGDMSLRTALVSGPQQGAAESTLLDAKVCECCGTDAVMTPSGSVVVYRDRSDQERRDIWFVREDKNAASGWTQPAPVHIDGWQIEACPVNGPAIDATDEDLVVAWYSGAETRPGVHVAFGNGQSFAKPITVDPHSMGRVDVVMLDGGQEAIVSDILPVLGGGQLQLHRVAADGAVGKPYNVAKVDGGRPSGFPKMARLSDQELLVVWTKPAKKKGGPMGLGATRVSIADIPAIKRTGS